MIVKSTNISVFNDCVSNVCESVHKKFLPAALIFYPVEEAKYMNGPSVTEMNRGGVYEMDKKKCHKNGNATRTDIISYDFLARY